MDALIRTTKLIWLITNLHSKGLERSKSDMGAINKNLFDVFIRVLALQIKVYHFRMSK
jgi:hypothetical protein